MPTFRDNTGREWRVRLTPGANATIRREYGLDLADAARRGDLATLGGALTDAPRLVGMAYHASGAERAGVSPEDFGRSLVGDPIVDAARALARELAELVPDAHKRAALRALIREV